MHTASKIARITALAIGIAGALAWGQADAAAFQLKENSAKGLGRAFAGSTSAWGDASVVATNPASMRLLNGRQFQADVSAIAFSAKLQDGYSGRFAGPGGAGTGMPIQGGNGGDAGMIAPVPATYFHIPFGENDNMHFGMSLTAPFGFKTEYDRNWVGRYHGVKTDLKAVDLGAAFSYDVNPYVSFGVSVFYEHLAIELSNAVDFGAVAYGATNGASAALGLYPGSADGFATIEGKNNAWGYVLGATFSVTEDTNIALSYRSKVKHKIDDGKATFDVPGNVATALQTQARGIFVNTGGKAELTLPASATLSLTHRVNDRWTVMGDLSRTAWAPSFDQVVVDFASNQPNNVLVFGYDDTTFASIGAEYKLSDTITLRGGVAYDQTPTTDEHRDVRVPDVSRRWLSFGLGWTPSEKTEFNFGYTHLFTNQPSIDITSATRSTLKGSYEVRGDVLGASINYKF
ncbi:outer membrane protein transport protein [Thermomonas fusca]|uniref:outer membrane protein transport protein n=1 Tax=Thermomonas fusca TaxID=215690 RepID=UPI0004090435|nr:outer membrane protein transport protein [Thermomonas fusca]